MTVLANAPQIGSASTDATTSRAVRTFRPDVQGLRAVAVLIVFFYHYEFWPFRGGYVGVDVFFVISGFVITTMLRRERAVTGGVSIPSFMARRIRRVLPAATVVLVATVSATYLLAGVVTGRAVGRDAVASALFVANRHFADINTRYLAAFTLPSPLLHFWSLSIEEQFYLLWPATFFALALLARRVRRAWVLPGAVAVIATWSFWHAATMTATNPTRAYYDTTTRVGELLVGCLLAILPSLAGYARPIARLILGWAGLFVIMATAILYTTATAFPGVAVLVPVFGAAAVIASGDAMLEHGPEWLLAMRPLRWIGDRSYSIYLWHWPVFVLAWERIGHVPSFGGRVALGGLAMVLSIASYRMIEQPIRTNNTLRQHRGRTLGVGAALIATGVAVPLVWSATSTDPPTWHGVVKPVTTIASLTSELNAGNRLAALPALVVPTDRLAEDSPVTSNCLVSFVSRDINDIPATGHLCTAGDLLSHRMLVLYGDSHAIEWLPAIDQIAKREHFEVTVITRGACPIADVVVWNIGLNRPYNECLASHAWAVAKIAQLHPFAVVVSDSHSGVNLNSADQPMSPATYFAGLDHALHSLVAPHRIVVEIGPTPLPNGDPVSCLGIHFLEVHACSRSRASAVAVSELSDEAAVVTHDGAKYISTVPWFCTASGCPLVVNHLSTYADVSHISGHYAIHLALLLQDALTQAGIS